MLYFLLRQSQRYSFLYQRLDEITVYMVYFYVFQSVLLYKVI